MLSLLGERGEGGWAVWVEEGGHEGYGSPYLAQLGWELGNGGSRVGMIRLGEKVKGVGGT